MVIDFSHQAFAQNTVGSRLDTAPYTRIGSVFNVVFCAGLAVFFLWTGLNDKPPGYVGMIFPALLEVIFVRVCIRAFRGDFDDFVLAPDDDEDAR